jgi:membrane protein DedA with SNARE-associated domain
MYTGVMQAGLVLQLIAQYRYAFLIPGALFIGPLVSLTAGVLIRLGILELFATAFILMATELLGDVFWYWAGYHWGMPFIRRFGKFVGIHETRVEVVTRLYNEHHDMIILVSKLTAGFGFAPAIYFTAGLSRVPFRRYMLINIAGQVVWTSAMLAIGFYLGHFYLQVNGALDRTFFITTVLVSFAIVIGVGRHLWEDFTHNPDG